MSQVRELAAVYRRHVSAPWQRTLAGAQRVMMIVYPKERERTLRAHVGEFEQATVQAGHKWQPVNCTTWFAEWMADQEYRDAYFEDPEFLGAKLDEDFRQFAASRLTGVLEKAGENTVVGVLGVASLYGFLRVSTLIHDVERSVEGRMAIFFPGTKNDNNYRLMDARDGWNYLAQPITLGEAWVP